MARRISIIVIVLFGTVASMIAPMRVGQSWRGEYSIVAMTPRAASPVTDSENRKRPVTETAITVARRTARKMVTATAFVPLARPPRPRVQPAPPLPRSPEIPGLPPRAPPAVC